MCRQRRASVEEVNGVETVLEILPADAALGELLAAPAESLSSLTGHAAEMAGAAVADFLACYARELSSLVWFVMGLGADVHRAADVAQSGPPGPAQTPAPDGDARPSIARGPARFPPVRAASAPAGDLGYTSYPHRTLS
jgi:hypothetical protein